MFDWFTKEKPTIPTLEKRMADYDRQVTECESDITRTEAEAVDASLSGGDVAKAVEELTRAKAFLEVPRTVREQVASELTALRAAAAEAEAERRKAEALQKIAALADKIEAISEELVPKIGALSSWPARAIA